MCSNLTVLGWLSAGLAERMPERANLRRRSEERPRRRSNSPRPVDSERVDRAEATLALIFQSCEPKRAQFQGSKSSGQRQ